jgi:hypothetical protein
LCKNPRLRLVSHVSKRDESLTNNSNNNILEGKLNLLKFSTSLSLLTEEHISHQVEQVLDNLWKSFFLPVSSLERKVLKFILKEIKN